MSCEHCKDPDGQLCYPSYGVGPHVCGWRMGKPVIGHSVGLPPCDWPEDFVVDIDQWPTGVEPPVGTWFCPHCREGLDAARSELAAKLFGIRIAERFIGQPSQERKG